MRGLRFLRSPAHHCSTATALEYALIAALIAVPIMAATTSVGRELAGLLHNFGAYLAGVPLVEPDPPLP